MLVCTLRAWFDRDEAGAPAWYTALNDPARPWTVAKLADGVDVSRSAFARRFTTIVGQPPLAYLTRWRMTIASDAFNFSAAFKRVKGMCPSSHRAHIQSMTGPSGP